MTLTFFRESLVVIILLAVLTAKAEINIGVAIPNDGQVSEKSLRMLDSRLKREVSSCGVSSTQWGDFFLVPKLTVASEETIETGMKKIFSMEIDMTLSIEQLATGTNYGSETWTLKGTGDTRDKAMLNAFNNWRGGSTFSSYIDKSKRSIEEYFVSNRQALLNKASQKAKAGEYDEALAILSSYPTNLQGSDAVIAQMTKIYEQMLANECGLAIQQARSALAINDYGTAAYYLAQIKPDSPCVTESHKLQDRIRSQSKQDQDEEYARQQAEADRAERREGARLRSAERLEKARIKAVSDIAKAYYQRTQRHYHYHVW